MKRIRRILTTASTLLLLVSHSRLRHQQVSIGHIL